MKRNLLLFYWLLACSLPLLSQSFPNPGGSPQRNSLRSMQIPVGGVVRTMPSVPSNGGLNANHLNVLQGGGMGAGGGLQLLTTSCGEDTVQYPLAKATSIVFFNGFNGGVAAGQWYPAPQPITVTGFAFYAFVDSITNQTVTLDCELYAANPDSTPGGGALASGTVTIDSAATTLGDVLTFVNFSSPVVVNSDYVITVSNASGIDVAIGFNDPGALPPDGLQEWLALINIPPLGWFHTNDPLIFPVPIDADALFMPFCTYDITAEFTPDTVNVCTGVTVDWINQSSPIFFSRFYNQAVFFGVDEQSFDWNYDDGSPIDNVIDASHSYVGAGSFSPTLVDSMFGWSVFCEDIFAGSVVVDPGTVPTAAFNSVVTGADVTFTDASTGLPTTWEWDFGDGSPHVFTQNTNHTYSSGGTFTVCLIVTNSCGADTLCDDVTITCVDPVADFQAISVGLDVDFTDLSTGPPTSWEWDFGDGSPVSNLQNPTHTYATADTFTVCLIATNICASDTFCFDVISGCSTSVADWTHVANNLSVDFTDASTNSPTNWIWDFGDGSPLDFTQNPTHVYATPGTYTVCLTATNGCNATTDCQTITVVCPIPVASYTETHSNLAFTFTSTSTNNPTSLQWTFGDLQSGSGSPVNHTYASVGTYTVCLIATNSCGADTTCNTVNALCPLPVADFSSTVNQLSVNFNDNTGGTVLTWEWDFGDGSPVSNLQNPSHTYTAGGLYTVCLIASNSCGADTICQDVFVECILPNGLFDFFTTSPTVAFTNQSTGTITSFAWDFGDGSLFSTVNNPSHTYAATGVYTVCLYNTNICGTDTFCRDIVITCVPPTAGFNSTVSSDSVASFTSTSSANTTAWNWNFGDGSPINTQQNPTHIYDAPGTYTVCLTVTNNCGTNTICHTVTITCQFATSAFTASLSNGVATFTDVSLNATAWEWDFDDGTPNSFVQNPVHSFTQSGIYTVCLTVTSFCGTNTSCQNLIVSCLPPVPNFNYTNGTNSVTFSGLSPNQPTQWLWDFGDGNSSTFQNPVHGYQFAGNYMVCLGVWNSCGYSDTCKLVQVTAINVDESWMQQFSVFPNPNDGHFVIAGDLPTTELVNISLTDLTGRQVRGLWNGELNGTFRKEFAVDGLAKGIYFLRLEAGEKSLVRKLIVE